MRLRRAKIILEICFAMIGGLIVALSLFAYQLHLDPNQGMGPNRIILTSFGVFFLLLSFCILISPVLIRLSRKPFFQKISQISRQLVFPVIWLTEIKEAQPTPKKSQGHIFWYAFAGAGISILISWFYITSGRFITWNHSTVYFDKLANAFLSGKLSLLEEPPAALVALEDPYHYKNRGGIGEYIWDASLYKRNYYYYWGPVPALLAAGVKAIHHTWVIEDQYLIFFSNSGLAISIAALFYWLRTRFFPRFPGWLVTGMIMVGALNTPIFWLINHAAVHEVPIAVGQLFLITGMVTAWRGMDAGKHQNLMLLLTGILWGAAIGSRSDLLLSIGWMFCVVVIFLFIKNKNKKYAFVAILALVMPLLVCGAGLGWYNYARFGSILESGHRYQLTGGAMPNNYKDIVSLDYILPNIYNLLIRPVVVQWNEFPFFFTPYLQTESWPKLIFFPRNKNYFFTEPIAGIFFTTPIYWFFFLYPIGLLRKGWSWLKEKEIVDNSLQMSVQVKWTYWMVAGGILFNLAFLSIFIYSTMRYEADYSPLMTILTMLSLGWLSIQIHNRPRLWKVVILLITILILFSLAVSLFSNFQNSGKFFANNNPVLYEAIRRFFIKK